MRRKTPERWAVKDIAGLYYSSKDIGLTKRDLLRFMRLYRGKPLREILETERSFWNKVVSRGNKLYASEQRKALTGKPSNAHTPLEAKSIDESSLEKEGGVSNYAGK